MLNINKKTDPVLIRLQKNHPNKTITKIDNGNDKLPSWGKKKPTKYSMTNKQGGVVTVSPGKKKGKTDKRTLNQAINDTVNK